ncbi:MAG: response regulator transcription factor [bacterium]
MNTRVAIVEDNEPLRRIVSGWLEQSEGMTLAGAYEDAERAMAELPAQQPDVVLVDINLPGADGIECVRHLKERLPATQFVMVTVYEDAQRIFQALAAGATGYLLKRASRTQLLNAVAEVRRGGSPMSAQIARKVVQSFLRPEAQPQGDALSPREREVLAMLARGLLYKEIAGQLDSSVYTINAHVRRIYEKLQVHSRTEAVAKFTRH